MSKKSIAIILIVFGILSILSREIFIGIVTLGIGYFLYTKNKDNNPKKDNSIIEDPKSKNNVSTNSTLNRFTNNEQKKENHFHFNVAGITKNNDENKSIQKIIKEFVKIELEFHGSCDKYEGMTNKEILEYGGDVYEADIYGNSEEIILEPEPENPYDPKAIKVIHEEIGHVGYVPADWTNKVHSVLNKDYNIEWKLVGGKMKYVDYNEEKVKIKTLNYGMVIDIYY